ncbi:D-glycero-beta-D-manno-heptose-7-phosphate kinase [Brasilonema octagenarum UFV-E1]|uniref:D-glycero-beta-D-manno-heptose-7-phosphate kinase n=1 Tax=Brasilonema sennae CENA114 TaxID=415709 RepID=A0A856MPJ5_9CYAN|nr:D-glycero-beta-D-manno-heptose-7-phosphate kinase [Brasilonema sennae]QDL11237.1 D-glycero-beta-D-manno-heptose-7-phosphate kinase [Brasilonema sennae CENA114]QDL17582.1 D-glycero-beta-D-manno-heptose-7-phosphate kinase [Brasilonema octagenarum UFV-E1]
MSLDPDFAILLRASADRLFFLLEKFASARVLVIGDLTLDEFLTGQVERISREAPVLILRHETTKQVPGGGANAIYNFAQLGAKVLAVGLLGKDEQGKALRSLLEAAGINTDGVFVDSSRPTVTKTRISGHSRQSVTQQIVRLDRKSDDLPDLDLQVQISQYIKEQINSVDAVVCSDYGDGTLTQPVISAALSASRTIVDAQKHLERYRRGTLFTPNLPEAEFAVGYAITDEPTLTQAGQDLLALTQAQHILITRGEQGMSMFNREGSAFHIPAFNRTKVFDVTGAGDTVVAALTLGLTVGASAWEAAVLGNLAASIVVRRFGTTTTTPEEMRVALQRLLEEG